MTDKQYAKLILFMLEYADDRMGRAGCNDFPEFEKMVPNVEDRQAFCKAMEEWNGSPDDTEPPDFFVCAYLKALIESEEIQIKKVTP